MVHATRHVAVLMPSYQWYDRGLMHGIATYLQQSQREWSVYLEDDPRVCLPDFNNWNGDGIITNFNNRKVIQSLGRMDIPVVGLGGGYMPLDEHIPYAYVGTDNHDIARLAFEHLYGLGLRRFAYCGEPTSGLDTWSQERGETLQHYASESGCPCALFTAGHSTRLEAWTRSQERLQKWLGSLAPPVGVMASCDSRGRHVLEACHALGAHVPEDFAVLGVDNDHVLCDLSTPPMTSVEQNTHRIGYAGAEILDQMMSNKKIQGQFIAIKAHAVVARQSTDVLKIEDEEVANAIRFIRKHACDPIQVRDVLASIPVSRSTLENRFKQLLGRSVHAEIRRIQIEQAKKLLAETDLSFAVVAGKIGIQTVQYFTTLMRQETGSTPAKFRNLARM